jgi:hypothetical protein
MIVAAPGCAEHRTPRAAGEPGAPRVGWIVMYGDSDNPDAEFACQSNPRTDCVVPASRPDGQTFSEVHLYLHPTPAETKYSGAMQIGFFRGNKAAQELKASDTVKPGQVANHSIVGIVTDKAGPQVLNVEFKAVMASGEIRQIHDQVTVLVR